MKKKEGFTLLELLVVIAIIALLLAIILPAMRATKRQASAAVCKANLHEWAVCYQLYTQEHDDLFPIFVWNVWETSTYMQSYRDYYSNLDKIRLCPEAKIFKKGAHPIDANREFGTTFSAWWANPQTVGWMNKEDCGFGSYGENAWIRTGTSLDVNKQWHKMSNITCTSQVPFIGDARWNNAMPEDGHPLPLPVLTEANYYPLAKWTYVECYAMRRHKNGSNMAFAEGSVRTIPAEQMWSLKWNRKYQIRQDVDLSWMENF